ncbi:MAG: tetratricopeptide repeat protein [Thermodesulfobacteriota bacterium]
METHYNLGLLLRDKGSVDGAIREFEEALRIDPAFQGPRTALEELSRRGIFEMERAGH